MATKGIDIKTKRARLLDSSPTESDDEEKKTLKRRLSISIDNTQASPSASTNATNRSLQRIIVSERQQMAILKQLTASEEQLAQSSKSNSPSSTCVTTGISKSRLSRINKRNEHGETILHVLARKGETKQLKKVVKAGGNVNEVDYAGWTPLHEAVNKNQYSAARLLLKSGASANAFGPEATTPLHDAVLNNNTKLVELLLNYSANPNQGDLKQITPFALAASNSLMLKILRRELIIDRQDDSLDEEDDTDDLGPLSPLSSFESEQDTITPIAISAPNAATTVDSSGEQRHLLVAAEDKQRTLPIERLKFKRIDRMVIRDDTDKDFSDEDALDYGSEHSANSAYRRSRNKSSESCSSHGKQINQDNVLLDSVDAQETTGDTRQLSKEQRNPYDFDSEEEEGEIRDDISDTKSSTAVTHSDTTFSSYDTYGSRTAYNYPSHLLYSRNPSSSQLQNHYQSPPSQHTYSSLHDSSHYQTHFPSSHYYRDEYHEHTKATWRHNNIEKKERSSKSVQDSTDKNRFNSSSSSREKLELSLSDYKQTDEAWKNSRLLKVSSSSSSNDESTIKIVTKRKRKENVSLLPSSETETITGKHSISDDEKLFKQKKIFSNSTRYNKKFEESMKKQFDEIAVDVPTIKPKIPVLKIVMPTSQHHLNEKKIKNTQQMLPYVLKPDSTESSSMPLEDTSAGVLSEENTIQATITTTTTTMTTATIIEDNNTCALVIDTSLPKDTTMTNEEINTEVLFETPSSCSSSSSSAVITVMKRSLEDVDEESVELLPRKQQALEPLSTDTLQTMPVVPSLSPPVEGERSTTLSIETHQSITTTPTTITTVTEIISTTITAQDEEQPQSEQEQQNTTTAAVQQIPHRRETKSTRTLRSHARKQTLNSITITNAINKKTRKGNEKQRRKIEKQPQNQSIINSETSSIQTSENSLTNNQSGSPSNNHDENQNSSNHSSDDMISSDNVKNLNDDGSSCSSGDGTNKLNDFDNLSSNKRKLRERLNASQSIATSGSSSNNLITATAVSSTKPSTIPSSTNSSSSVAAAVTLSPNNNVSREVPINCIKKFLEIRRQIDKRHEMMMHGFMVPKTPKDFDEFSMVKKSYLISSSTVTPEDLHIKKCPPPTDLDKQLTELFIRQEDERYRMRLRHQVERDKLILSHEQEILRLYGNAARSSMNQDIPFSYCTLLKDDEVYNFPSSLQTDKEHLTDNDGKHLSNETAKRKHRWNARFLIKTIDDSNFKYKRYSQDLNQRQRIEAETLYAMQRMLWLKHLSKEPSRATNNDIFIPFVEIKENFWTAWQKSQL